MFGFMICAYCVIEFCTHVSILCDLVGLRTTCTVHYLSCKIILFVWWTDSEKVTSGGLLSLWMRQKSKKASTIPVVVKKDEGNDAKGMYLDDLASLEDPEIAKLYLGSPR